MRHYCAPMWIMKRRHGRGHKNWSALSTNRWFTPGRPRRPLMDTYQEVIEESVKRLWELIEKRTADEDMQDKIFEALLLLKK